MNNNLEERVKVNGKIARTARVGAIRSLIGGLALGLSGILLGCGGGGKNPYVPPANNAPNIAVSGANSVLEKEGVTRTYTITDIDGNNITSVDVSAPAEMNVTTSALNQPTVTVNVEGNFDWDRVAGFDSGSSANEAISVTATDSLGASTTLNDSLEVKNRVYEVFVAEFPGSGAITSTSSRDVSSFAFDGQSSDFANRTVYVTNSPEREADLQVMQNGDVLLTMNGPQGEDAVYIATPMEGSGWIARVKQTDADDYYNGNAKLNADESKIALTSTRTDGLSTQIFLQNVDNPASAVQESNGIIDGGASFDENDNLYFASYNNTTSALEIKEKDTSGLVTVLQSDSNYHYINPVRISGNLYSVRAPVAGGDRVLCKNGTPLYTPNSGWSVANVSKSADGKIVTFDVKKADNTLQMSYALETANDNLVPLSASSDRTEYATARQMQ